jgi:tetratricopeptide (TPR) repeat protein
VRRLAARVLAASVVLCTGTSATLGAQQLPLLRSLPQAPGAGGCTAGPVTRPAADQREQARRLGESAAQSLLGGELTQARELLRRAVALDPSSAELTYRLARTLEDLGDEGGAADGYCRLRALDAPADARADADTRLAAIVARRGRTTGEAGTSFRDGVARFEAGDLTGADAAFSRAITAAPTLAPAYYDRAITRLARGRDADALADFDRYARLAPTAVNADLRRARDVLRRGRYSPGTALAAGLLPGGAQLYTSRAGMGLVVGLVAAAGAYLVVDGQEEFRERTAIDPFGNPYTFRDPNPTTAYPRRGIGLGVIGVAVVGGAIEGFLHARQGRSAVEALRSRLRVGTAAP